MRGSRGKQIQREARATYLSLALIIVFWLIAGFGAASLEIEVFQLPLWVITGCIGTWLFAILLVYILVTRVFVDIDLEDETKDG